MRTVVADDGGYLKAGKDAVLPRTFHHRRDNYLVSLVKRRPTPLSREICLIHRPKIAVEIRDLVDGFAVRVIPDQGEVPAKAFLDFENTAVVKRRRGRRVLIVLQQ